MLELTSARLRIREVEAEDLPALLPVYTSNPAFVQQNEGSEGEVGRYDLARWRRDWQIAQMMPGNHWLGCYLKTEQMPVGIVLFLAEHEEDGQPWLGSLVVHKEYQRQGLGTEIFQRLTDYFRQELGWSNLRAGVKAQNEVGLAFLERMGFQMVKSGNGRFSEGIQTFFVADFAL